MVRSAAGMARTGSFASPEVTAITSMPLNDTTPMKMTIATTLMSANQYSIEPKLLTDLELKYSSTKANPSDQSHTGVPGNQKVMYTPAATASPPTAITCAIQ